MRTARASGWRCIVAIARSRPTATPACGPPISLSPENSATSTPAATESRTSGSSASPYSRGSSSAPLPRSSSSSSPRSRASDASAGQRRLLGEADDAEVRGVHAQQRHGALADRLGVVAQVGAVRRADLDERRAGLAHHVGDAEAAADLDQLAARDHHLAAGAERGEREQQRRGVVVDRDPGLRARDARQQIGEVAEARSALPGVEVELDVRVALGGGGHRGDRRPRERRASEVRVDDHAARVDDAAQARLQAGGAIGDRLGGGLLRAARRSARSPRGSRRAPRGPRARSPRGRGARPAGPRAGASAAARSRAVRGRGSSSPASSRTSARSCAL